ncbi:MAG: hypothetical protein ACFBSG_01035 [Leptolyngbyaceae cyanobacterium]
MSVRGVLDMSGRVPNGSYTPHRSPSARMPAVFRQRRLWRRLVTYRPLIVLASIWIGLLAIALLAYSQLLQTPLDSPSSAPTPAAEVYPHELQAGADTTDAAATDSPPAVINPATPPPAAPEAPQVSGWTLLVLVSSCAGGCCLLSLFLKAPRRPRRSAQRRSFAKSHRRLAPRRAVISKTQAPASPRKLDVYNPQQPLVAKSESKPQADSRAQSAPMPQQPLPPTAQTSEVTIVSEQTEHRLDWPQDSLVNTSDVRQRRSLSSFM